MDRGDSFDISRYLDGRPHDPPGNEIELAFDSSIILPFLALSASAADEVMGTSDSASAETELSPARAPTRRSTPRPARCPFQSRRGARCHTYAGRGTIGMPVAAARAPE